MVARIARARFLILAILRSKNTRCRVVGITRSRSPPASWFLGSHAFATSVLISTARTGQRKGYATVDRDSGCVDLIETGGATASALELLEESPRSPCGVG